MAAAHKKKPNSKRDFGSGSDNKKRPRTGRLNVDWNYSSDSEASDSEHIPNPNNRNSNDQDDHASETAEEMRLRMANQLLQSVRRATAQAESDDEEAGNGEVPDQSTGLDAISQRIHKDLLKSEGRLRQSVADIVQFESSSIFACSKNAHRASITSLSLSEAEDFCFTGGKDASIIRWDVEQGKRVATLTSSKSPSSHSDEILSLCLSSDGRYLASGGRDCTVKIWDCRNNSLVDTFKGHRDAVSGLSFRKGTHWLYSCSHDRSVRVWSVDDMAFVDTLFGHQAEINSIDCMFRERAITSSVDRSVRFWKIPEETQLVLQGNHRSSIDCIKMIDEVNFLSGSQDGSLALWNSMRKKPCCIVRNAHGNSWVSAVAALPNSDLIASGGNDGFVRFWKVECQERRIVTPSSGKLAVPGFVNALAFGSSGRVLVAGTGQEHRLGRWSKDTSASNQLFIARLERSQAVDDSENFDSGDSEDDSASSSSAE